MLLDAKPLPQCDTAVHSVDIELRAEQFHQPCIIAWCRCAKEVNMQPVGTALNWKDSHLVERP